MIGAMNDYSIFRRTPGGHPRWHRTGRMFARSRPEALRKWGIKSAKRQECHLVAFTEAQEYGIPEGVYMAWRTDAVDFDWREADMALVCSDLSLGATYPDGSRIPFVAGSIVRFHGAGVYVKTRETPGAPVYIDAWRHADRERPFVIAGPTGTVPGMVDRYRSANALTRDLRGAMVGWSEALADRIAGLAPGQSLTVSTLVGHATIAREV